MPQATLDAIRKKVRRLTRSPAEAQLTTDELDEYINTFILYDFPQRIQTLELRRNIAFFTDYLEDRYQTIPIIMSADTVRPGRGVTGTNVTVDNFDLARDIIFTDKPVYISGEEAYVTQSREDFFSLYPHDMETRDTQKRGDGAQTNFTGFLTGTALRENVGILRRHVLLTAQDVNGDTLHVYDDGAGTLIGDVGVGNNTVDYQTGEYDVTFATAPANTAEIYAEFARERLTKPDTVLYFNNGMELRPVPDKGYRVEMEAQIRPLRLLEATDVPEIAQWWQYIAYGAAKKVFEDRMDMESVALIQPEMDNQERFVLRNTILQAKKERAGTIYAGGYEGSGHGHDGVV